ncbi:MAG TPA: hypothetical protein VF458_23890 [Ktedonobacteraceae bacterium]
MHISELTLHTQELQEEYQFYTRTLSLPLLQATTHAFTVQAGTTRLTFQHTAEETLYHFAWRIPSNQIEAARAWLVTRSPLLRLEKQDEFSFQSWNSTSLYFRDPANHILEFIAHHDLENHSSEAFGPQSILAVCEIGMAFESVPEQVKVWQNTFGLAIYRGSLGENFAAVGDIYGLFITVQKGRNWFPTRSAAPISPVDITIKGSPQRSQQLTPYPYTIQIH